jgi:lysophospholipid acyltransferase (LPLAT)-like uncharacterized protein
MGAARRALPLEIPTIFCSGVVLSLLDRFKITLISTLGYWIIRIIGGTLRWEVIDWQNLEQVHDAGKRWVLAFWHGRIFMATYYFRNKGIVVLTSQNRDGEYIARVIQRFGYGVARGSSTRGSHRAAVEALRALANGKDVGITMDGPRGPRYVAKRGAAFIARKSGNPVVPFSVSAEKKWVMRSWDQFQIPKPFSRAVVLIGNPIYIDAGAAEQDIRAIEERIQNSLDELRNRGDGWRDRKTDR